MENKITVRNLNLYYGSFHALKRMRSRRLSDRADAESPHF